MAQRRQKPRVLVLSVLEPIAMAKRILPGGVWPRTWSGQSVPSDPRNHQKSLVFRWFYEQFWLTPIGRFALVLALTSDFAAQA